MSTAQTRIAARTRIEPGRTGTRTPASPTAIASATRTSTPLTAVTLPQADPGQTHDGPGPQSGAARGSAVVAVAQLSLSGATAGVAASLLVSSIMFAATSLSASPCSRAWWAQNEELASGQELDTEVGLGAASVAAVGCGQRRSGGNCSRHVGPHFCQFPGTPRERFPQRSGVCNVAAGPKIPADTPRWMPLRDVPNHTTRRPSPLPSCPLLEPQGSIGVTYSTRWSGRPLVIELSIELLFATLDPATPTRASTGRRRVVSRFGADARPDGSTTIDTAHSQGYNAAHLLVLEGLEAVRKRPGMYIGSTDTRGLMQCLWEIIDNGVDEALAGVAKHIDVTLHPDGSAEVLRRRSRHPGRQGAQDRAARRRGHLHQAARGREVRRRLVRRHRRSARRRRLGGQRALDAARRGRRPLAGPAGHVVPARDPRRLRRRRARGGVRREVRA